MLKHAPEPGVTIKTFLLTRLSEEIQVDGGRRRREIESHNDRSMVVTWQHEAETVTRCGTCTKESSRPCTPLRLLAARYNDHPEFEEERALVL
jgi:hypothetical protein